MPAKHSPPKRTNITPPSASAPADPTGVILLYVERLLKNDASDDDSLRVLITFWRGWPRLARLSYLARGGKGANQAKALSHRAMQALSMAAEKHTLNGHVIRQADRVLRSRCWDEMLTRDDPDLQHVDGWARFLRGAELETFKCALGEMLRLEDTAATSIWLNLPARVDRVVARALTRGEDPARRLSFDFWITHNSAVGQIVAAAKRGGRDVRAILAADGVYYQRCLAEVGEIMDTLGGRPRKRAALVANGACDADVRADQKRMVRRLPRWRRRTYGEAAWQTAEGFLRTIGRALSDDDKNKFQAGLDEVLRLSRESHFVTKARRRGDGAPNAAAQAAVAEDPAERPRNLRFRRSVLDDYAFIEFGIDPSAPKPVHRFLVTAGNLAFYSQHPMDQTRAREAKAIFERDVLPLLIPRHREAVAAAFDAFLLATMPGTDASESPQAFVTLATEVGVALRPTVKPAVPGAGADGDSDADAAPEQPATTGGPPIAFSDEERARYKAERDKLRRAAGSKTPAIIGESDALLRAWHEIYVAAKSKERVLITGETGTGKLLAAKVIHYASDRHNCPFERLDCGTLSDTLAESELFGHVKGAFTGAVNDKKGRFQLADRGTLCLEEVQNLSAECQAKLLGVLDEHKFRPLGGERDIVVDVRVIAATNAALDEAVRDRKFRQDLYGRFNVLRVTMPPLRQRPGDIRLLATKFGKGWLTETEIADLEARKFSENVRGLENEVKRMIAERRAEHTGTSPASTGKGRPKIALTKEQIETALAGKGTIGEAAIELIDHRPKNGLFGGVLV